MSTTPREPTNEECNARARVGDGYACWYPQMGGYSAKCVLVPIVGSGQEGDADCFDVYVWHDGEWPFGEGLGFDEDRMRKPRYLHHCAAEQFIEFGKFALEMTKRT